MNDASEELEKGMKHPKEIKEIKIVAQKDKALSKEQQTFNRLTKRISTLQDEIVLETEKCERLLTLHTGKIPKLEKNIAEDFEVARLVKRRQRDFMRALGGVVKIGVDADDVHVAHHQQRRVFQVGAVFEKLVIGGVEVFLFALVFPAEEIFFPDIGPAFAAAVLGRAFFKSE